MTNEKDNRTDDLGLGELADSLNNDDKIHPDFAPNETDEAIREEFTQLLEEVGYNPEDDEDAEESDDDYDDDYDINEDEEEDDGFDEGYDDYDDDWDQDDFYYDDDDDYDIEDDTLDANEFEVHQQEKEIPDVPLGN